MIMEIFRGICTICVSDKQCSFPRKFPVLECEEYSDYEPNIRGSQKKKTVPSRGRGCHRLVDSS